MTRRRGGGGDRHLFNSLSLALASGDTDIVITVNDTPQSEGEEEETEELVNQVLDEIGITLDTQMVKAPAGGVAMTAAAAAAPAAPMAEAAGAASDTGLDTDLQDRLNNLRR